MDDPVSKEEKNDFPIGSKNWLRYFQFVDDKEKTSDTRNILLIIFTLVAAVTFQCGVNPPGGVWQDSKDGHIAGRAVYASQDEKAYYVFLIFNTLAFSNSVLIILSLTHKFPFRFEIIVASVSMVVTYGSAIFAVSPQEDNKLNYVLIVAAGPFVFRLLVLLFNLFLRKRVVQYLQGADNNKSNSV